MSHALIVDLARNAIMLALLIAGPMLTVALLVGLTVSVMQAVTQIQEQTLAFVPKLVAVCSVFLLALPWVLQVLVKYTAELFRSLPALLQPLALAQVAAAPHITAATFLGETLVGFALGFGAALLVGAASVAGD